MKDLPKFRLCHPKYWDPNLQKKPLFDNEKVKPDTQIQDINKAKYKFSKLGK